MSNIPQASPVTAGDRSPTEVLAEAARLEQVGRRVEAVALLTEANRRRPDVALERRLVQLRHDAFAELEPASPVSPWPPEVPDRFAGETGLPEVGVADLTAQTLSAGILHHGALVVRGLVPPAGVERLVGDIDRAFEAFDAGMAGAETPQTAPWFAKFRSAPEYNLGPSRRFVRDGGGVWLVDSPRALFDVLEAFEEAGLRRVLTGHLGEAPALSVKKCTLRRVPVTSSTDWHQDGAFLGDAIRTVNVWLALTRCGGDADAPGLDVVPRRFDHVVETGTEGAWFDWAVGQGVVDRYADTPVIRPLFEPGDALLFDQFLLHRTAIDPGMTRERHAIESWFFAPSTYPTAQVPVVF
ncbi:MAG: phytanoyl-CoA dioxygenase family protein [Acidimicrobiales bacterium]|nr:phytanoyl-CoA dioxygenase family protein [Acidimicrobiales bacterium]